MSYLGKVDMNDANIKHYSLTGSTLTTVDIGWVPPSEQSLRVTINGVVQQGGTFSISGSNLTLGGALIATDDLEVVGIQSVGNIVTPADSSVSTAKLADDSVTLDKMAGLARGKIIVGDASGDPSALTVGAANQVLKSDGTDVSWGADSGGLFASYAFIVDQKTQASDSGTFTSGAWRTRDLQTTISDTDTIVTSLTSNEFTLAAGNYLIKWHAPAKYVEENQTRLYDVTGTAAVQVGSSAFNYTNHPTYVCEGPSSGVARVTPSGSNVYRIEHYGHLTRATDGFGPPADIDVEIYTMVEIYKES